jgi:hypothetical protein
MKNILPLAIIGLVAGVVLSLFRSPTTDIAVAAPGQPVLFVSDEIPSNAVRSVELPMNGFGVYNQNTMENTVRYSIEASPGLQDVTIPPDGQWSFNQNWTVDTGRLATEYGVLGAAMCDVAARYSNAAHALGIHADFPDHLSNGIDLALVPAEDNVTIWGTPGLPGGADLTLTNTTDQTVRMIGRIEEDGNFYVYGWLL